MATEQLMAGNGLDDPSKNIIKGLGLTQEAGYLHKSIGRMKQTYTFQ